jgi:ribonucleoside-diphosphate reductase alpha chain
MAAVLAALFNRVEIPLHSRAVCHNRWEIGPAKDAAEPPTREPELPLPAPAAKPADIYEAGGVVYMTQPLSRPESLPGQTYKIKWPDGDHAMYITINDVIQDGRRRPFEIFINSKNMEHYAWTVGLTRMISAVFRRGGDVSFVVEDSARAAAIRAAGEADRRRQPVFASSLLKSPPVGQPDPAASPAFGACRGARFS